MALEEKCPFFLSCEGILGIRLMTQFNLLPPPPRALEEKNEDSVEEEEER